MKYEPMGQHMNPRDTQFSVAGLGESNKQATIKQPRIQQSTIKMRKEKLLTADQEQGLLIGIKKNDCLLHENDFESLCDQKNFLRSKNQTMRRPEMRLPEAVRYNQTIDTSGIQETACLTPCSTKQGKNHHDKDG
jgi:hypothetical protein